MPGDLLAQDSPTDTQRHHEREASTTVLPTPPVALRVAIVVLLATALELLVFRDMFEGTHIPPWDFLGSYNTDAFYAYSHGSYFSAPAWVPTTWAGYPGAAALQSGVWYLP